MAARSFSMRERMGEIGASMALFSLLRIGRACWDRTNDQRIMSPLL
jgi:hypothetical protein